MGDVLVDAVPPNAVHLCVDMQRIFSSDGPWPTPWMERVLPALTRIAKPVSPASSRRKRLPTQPGDGAATMRNGARRRATDWIRASLNPVRTGSAEVQCRI